MRIGSDIPVASTFIAESAVECGIDATGMAHIQSILTFMYRDAAMAALREYAANALDSHVRAGVAAPIEVTLPTEWEPTLTVVDHGLGLSEQDIIDVYSPYGTSTKRDRDDQVGAFGIGAKTGFTLASQFTVTGVKDGKAVSALFALNESGAATVEIISREATDAPNGVTVVVPVSDPAAMRQAAAKLFAFWPSGTVLVDGEAPVYLPHTMLQVTDTVFADHGGVAVDPRQARGTREDAETGVTVVMGNIPYAASVAMLNTVARRITENPAAHRLAVQLATKTTPLRLVYLAEIGEVDITPSREDLRDTPNTLTVLERTLVAFATSAQTAVEAALDDEPSAMHASVRLITLSRFLPEGALSRGEVRWRGQRLPHQIGLPFPVVVRSTTERSSRCTLSEDRSVHLGTDYTHIRVVTGVDSDRERTVRRLANRYMTKHDLTWLIMVPTPTMQVGWFAADPADQNGPLTAVTFDQFHREARALPTVSAGRREPEYAVWRGHVSGPSTSWTPSTITEWASTHGGRVLLATTYGHLERAVADDALTQTDLVVGLTGSQTADAFFRRFPSATRLDTVVREHARTLLREATDVEHLALRHTDDHALQVIRDEPRLRRLEPLRQMVADYVAAYRAKRATPAKRLDLLSAAQRLLGTTPAPTVTSNGLPLLDLTLGAIRQLRLSAPLNEDLVADLVTYLTAHPTSTVTSGRSS